MRSVEREKITWRQQYFSVNSASDSVEWICNLFSEAWSAYILLQNSSRALWNPIQCKNFYPNPALRFCRLRVENIRRPCGKDKDINAEPKWTYQARRSRQVLWIFLLQLQSTQNTPKNNFDIQRGKSSSSALFLLHLKSFFKMKFNNL